MNEVATAGRSLGGSDTALGKSLLEALTTLRLAEFGLLVVGFLLPCAVISRSFIVSTWTPYAALIAPWLLVGWVGIVIATLGRDRSAAAATAVVMSATITALRSGATVSALKGNIGRDLSVLTLAAVIAMWFVARQSGTDFKRLLPLSAAAGFMMCGLIGVVQVVVGPESAGIQLVGGRPSGLTPNPVYFGALMAAGLVWAAWHFRSSERNAWLLGVAGFAFFVGISGSRVATVSAFLVGVAMYSTSCDWFARARGFASLVLGLLISSIFMSVIGTGGDSVSRVSADASSGGRLQVWQYGWRAFLERPLFGWGIGRFRSAVQGEFDAEFVSRWALFDQQQAWFDPHNALVLFVVGLGLIGTAFLVVFVVSAVRRVTGPGIWMAVAIAATWCLQPVGLATLPIAMLLLGASSAPAAMPLSPPRWLVIGAATLSMALAAYVVVADLRMSSALESRRTANIEAAAGWFWRDAAVSDVVAQVWTEIATNEPDSALADDYATRAIAWTEQAIRYEPDRAYWWSQLALREFAFANYDEAEKSAREGIHRQPWHAASWRVVLYVANATGDEQLLEEANVAVCAMEMPECDESLL